MKRKTTALLLFLLLTACGEETANDIATNIEEGKYAAALAALDEKLLATPGDATLHALATQARVSQCIAEDCFSTEKDPLAALRTSLPLLPRTPVDLGDNRQLDIYNWLAGQAPAIAALPNQPAPLLTMQSLLAGTPLQTTYLEALFTSLSQQLVLGDRNEALTAMQNLAARQILPDAAQTYLNVLVGLASHHKALFRNHSIALRSRQKPEVVTPAMLSAMVPAAYLYYLAEDENNATTLLVTDFPTLLADRGWPDLLTPAAYKEMSAMLQTLLANESFQQEALRHAASLKARAEATTQTATVAAVSPTATVSATAGVQPLANPVTSETVGGALPDPRQGPGLYLERLELILNPDQQALWQAFLPAAKNYVLTTGDTDLLAAPLDATHIPAGFKATYTAEMLDLLAQLSAQGENILPLLDQIVTTEDDKPTRVKLEKMVQNGLTKSLEERNLDSILAYARFSPDVAREKRQAIVPVIIESVSEAFSADDFDQVTLLAAFLNDELSIDFNLGAILLKDFDAYLKKEKVAASLRADTPENLTRPQADVALDLGPKFTFLQEFFANDPGVVDGILKGLVLNAAGVYGTPNALYRLYNAFNDSSFPSGEKEVYLLSTLRNSISRDDNSSAVDIVNFGTKLNKQHPDLRLDFIASEALNRVNSLKDGRAVWQAASAEMKETFQAVRPEFKALMEGIDAFDAGHFAAAADAFAQLSSAYYLNQAQPYISHYIKTLDQFRGVYVPENLLDPHSSLAAILINPAQASGQSVGVGNRLTKADITLINRIGTVKITRPDQLATHYGRTYRTTVTGTLDFNSLVIVPNMVEAETANLPFPPEEVYGNIESIQLIEQNSAAPQLKVKLAGGDTVMFLRVASKPDYPQIPDGKFTIQRRLSQAEDGSELILPVGSILELTTDIHSPLQPTKKNESLGIIYPVSGLLHHPAKPNQPQELEGFYNPEHHTTNLVLTYPLPGDSGTATALARCQILDAQLLCGLHNQHNMRHKYAYLVAGAQTVESRQQSDSRLDALIEALEEQAKARAEEEARAKAAAEAAAKAKAEAEVEAAAKAAAEAAAAVSTTIPEEPAPAEEPADDTPAEESQ